MEQLRETLPDAGSAAGLVVVDRADGARLTQPDLAAVAAASWRCCCW